ncbi:response regulator transcription factor [Streptomyces sp. Pv4-95]|uniref:response regulator transcription factor n=1 Tax=Streptomyces sp. Pv4-95 TaxID=3049543 RepID=UPI003892600E
MARLLIIDDNSLRGQQLLHVLQRRRHTVHLTRCCSEALRLSAHRRPHAVLLDLDLPPRQGFALREFLRCCAPAPVVVRGEEQQIISALHAGAAGYMPASCSAELAALHLHTLYLWDADEPDVEVGGLRISVRCHRVTVDGREVDLRPTEFRLLLHLTRSNGRVVSRAELAELLWDDRRLHAERTVNVHLSALRRKLGESAARPRYVHSVHGVGVRLRAP